MKELKISLQTIKFKKDLSLIPLNLHIKTLGEH